MLTKASSWADLSTDTATFLRYDERVTVSFTVLSALVSPLLPLTASTCLSSSGFPPPSHWTLMRVYFHIAKGFEDVETTS